MTLPSLEILLVVGIVAFYIQDAALLLYHDEIAFEHVGGNWRALSGGTQWSGRFLFLPTLLAPRRPLSRRVGTQAPEAVPPARAMRLLQAGVTVLGVLLLVGVPVLLWRYPHPLALLALTAAIYLVALSLALPMWLNRDALGIDRRTVAWLAFESVACPPHAINLVRKLSLRHPQAGTAA